MANHFAMTGPSARLASSSFSHDGWLRSAVCCDGAAMRDLRGHRVERLLASRNSAVTRDVGMIGRPSSSLCREMGCHSLVVMT